MELSPQQKRVAELLLRGYQDRQIAASMNLSLRTVKGYFASICDKLEVDVNRVRAAVKLHEQRHILGVRCATCGEI